VQQVRAGKLRTELRLSARQAIDRLAIQVVGDRPVAQQRPGARLDAEGIIVATRLGRVRKPLERIACELQISPADGRLDKLGQRPD
jgi:hypothetical protein